MASKGSRGHEKNRSHGRGASALLPAGVFLRFFGRSSASALAPGTSAQTAALSAANVRPARAFSRTTWAELGPSQVLKANQISEFHSRHMARGLDKIQREAQGGASPCHGRRISRCCKEHGRHATTGASRPSGCLPASDTTVSAPKANTKPLQ